MVNVYINSPKHVPGMSASSVDENPVVFRGVVIGWLKFWQPSNTKPRYIVCKRTNTGEHVAYIPDETVTVSNRDKMVEKCEEFARDLVFFDHRPTSSLSGQDGRLNVVWY